MRKALLAAACAALACAAGAAAATDGGPVGGTTTAVAAGPGIQGDAHVDGSLVAFLDRQPEPDAVHLLDLASGADTVLPSPGVRDVLPDVDGGRVAFTRLTETASEIWLHDAASGTTTHVAPDALELRWGPSLGGPSLAWAEGHCAAQSCSGSELYTTVVVDDLASGTVTDLSGTDALNDAPAVSPDGTVVAWLRCSLQIGECDVAYSTKTAGVWSPPTVLATPETEYPPATDGTLLVYPRWSGSEYDLVYRSLATGEEHVLALPGNQSSPAVDDGLIVAESDGDIVAYEPSTDTLYTVTASPEVEFSPDVDVRADGSVVVAYSSWVADGDSDVHAVTFPRPSVAGGSPEQRLGDLEAQVEALGLPNGTESSLLAKLQAASASLAAGGTTAACGSLGAFVAEAQAQSGKKIPAADAAALVEAAEALEQALGC